MQLPTLQADNKTPARDVGHAHGQSRTAGQAVELKAGTAGRTDGGEEPRCLRAKGM